MTSLLLRNGKFMRCTKTFLNPYTVKYIAFQITIEITQKSLVNQTTLKKMKTTKPHHLAI